MEGTDQQRSIFSTTDSCNVRMKKPTRRGRGNNKKKMKNISLYYINVNGFKSKSISLSSIINELNKPDIIVLCEIKTVSQGVIRQFFKSEGYDIIVNKNSGLLVASKVKHDMVNVTSTDVNNLISASIKIGNSFYITVVAVYGPQENKSEDIRQEFFDELELEVNASMNRQDQNLIMVGDFNSKITCTNSATSPISPNGVLLDQLVKRFSMDIMNFSHKCSGKWTRVQEKSGRTEKSVIDYVITNTNFSKLTTDMIIDEDKFMAPFWIRSNKKKGPTRQHSDHNAFLVNFAVPCTEKFTKSQENNYGWKITSEGLEKFKQMTDCIDSDTGSDNLFSSFNKVMENAIDACFQRRRPKKKDHPNINREHLITYKPLQNLVRIITLYMKQGKAERIAAKKYIIFLQELQNQAVQKKKAEKITNVIEQIQCDDGTMSVEKFWKLKKSITAPDRSKSSVAVGTTEIFSGPAIVKEYEKEFSSRLAHRVIDKDFTEYEITTMKLFSMYLKLSAETRSEPDFTNKEVKEAIHSLTKGTAAGPDKKPPEIFLNAGEGLISLITKVFNHVKKKLEIPDDCLETIIVAIFKNKGSRKILLHYRGVFLTNILTKILEKVIKRRISPHLAKVNPLQAGSRRNRSTCDNIFILNAIIDHAKYMNKRLYITFYDYSQCFDSLWLEDSMISLWNIGIQNELFNLIFRLNESTKITVKTPYGLTTPFKCERIVKQGSVLSSNICSTSTAEICNQNQMGFAVVGETSVNDIVYVDDTTDPNSCINETIKSHNRIVNFTKSKRLSINYKKCCLLVINKKKHDSVPTLLIGNDSVPHASSTKFLGDVVNNRGTNTDLVEDRVKKGNAALVSCMAVCNEVTMGIHSTKVSMVLYHSVFLAMLLFNCQAWSNLTKDDLRKLEKIQLRYLKRVLRAPQSTSNVFVHLELGVLPISYEIDIRQLTFLHHITNLNNDDPVKRLYEEQLSLPYEKNWGNHMSNTINSYNLGEADIDTISRDKWKTLVKKAVYEKALRVLTDEAKSKTKTKHLKYQKFYTQPYLFNYHPKIASTIFRIRSRNVECRTNRKSSSQDLLCRLCRTEEENQDHIVNCPKIRMDGEILLGLKNIMERDVETNSNEVTTICNRFVQFNTEISELPS